MTMTNCAAVGIGGVVGALSRYGLSLAFNPADPAAFPWGTLLCNMAGCFALGWMSALAAPRLPDWLKLGMTTGVIGAFTTFSTFSVEMVHLLQNGQPAVAIDYGLASAIGGLALVRAGIATAERNLDNSPKEGNA